MDAFTYLTTKAAEETNEIGQALGKMSAYGPFDCDPNTGVSNIEHMIHEVNDLLGMLDMLRTRMLAEADEQDKARVTAIFEMVGDENTCKAKQHRLLKWAQRSVSNGRISEETYQQMYRDVNDQDSDTPES